MQLPYPLTVAVLVARLTPGLSSACGDGQLSSFKSTVTISSAPNDDGWSSCLATPKEKTVGGTEGEHIRLLFDGKRIKGQQEGHPYPGCLLLPERLQKRKDIFSHVEIEGAETCEDAVVSLEAHLRGMFQLELPPSYQTCTTNYAFSSLERSSPLGSRTGLMSSTREKVHLYGAALRMRRSEGWSSVDGDRQSSFRDTSDITTFVNTYGTKTCVVTPARAAAAAAAAADDNEKLVLRFNEYQKSLKTDSLQCPGKIRYELHEKEDFRRIMPAGSNHSITDFLDDFQAVNAESCEDAVKQLATYFRRPFTYDTLSSYQTLQYHLCVRYGGRELRAWVKREGHMSLSRDNTPTPGCLLYKPGYMAHPITFYRHHETRTLRILSLPCTDGTVYKGSLDGVVHARNRSEGKTWDMAQDPLAEFSILMPPLTNDRCRIAASFIFNGLGVMGKPDDDTPPFDLLQKEMCDLFHRDSRFVEKTDIPTVATPDTRNLHTRRTGGTIRPVKKPDDDAVDYRGGYKVRVKASIHEGGEGTDAPEAAKARGTQVVTVTSRREDEPTRGPEAASGRRGEDVVDAPGPSEESEHVLDATALSKTSEGSVEEGTGQTSKTSRRSKRWKSIRRIFKVLKPGKKSSYSVTASSTSQ
ncbi:hypothetical protein FOZ62_003731 [Perkinsus olseni]|uniref:Uncharacterized protein n=1 Tax=Perkinsus olseni TaxID=32597 RepID=A0A7J6QGV7_PEROL|nr:hypothetical protein FOZ62_003731 [Perkinsus olseni]